MDKKTDHQAADAPASNSTQETLPIAEIRDNVVVLKDGSFKAVVKADAINFDLMSTLEQEAVEYAYQALINSLYFPIQVSIQSRRISAANYLQKIEANLQQQNNMLLSVLMEDYLDFMADLVENTDIMSKHFFIIIPFQNDTFGHEVTTPDSDNLISKLKRFNKKSSTLMIEDKAFDNAKRELRYRTQVIIEGLRGCGVHAQALNTQQLIEMYYEYYNPQTSFATPINDFQDIATPIVRKAGEVAEPEIARTDDVPLPPTTPLAPTNEAETAIKTEGESHE